MIKFINFNTYNFINTFEISAYNDYGSSFIKYLTFNVFETKRNPSYKIRDNCSSFISFNVSYYYNIYKINNFKNVLIIKFIKTISENDYYRFIRKIKRKLND